MFKRSRVRGLVVLVGILVFAVIGHIVLHDSKAAVSADINNDGSVGIADLTVLAANYGQSGKTFSQGDITGDGIVNIYDFSVLAANWGIGSTASNCTIYASPSGGGNGSSATSPTTFSAAVSASLPGSVVCFKGGTYNLSSIFTSWKSGTSSAWITYRNYDSTPPVFTWTGGSNCTGCGGGLFQTNPGSNWSGTSYLVFDGLHFNGNNGVGEGISVKDGSHHITIKNSRFYNLGEAGVGIHAADYVRVENNMVSHTGYNQGWGSGVTLHYCGDNSCYGGSTGWYDTYQGFHNVIAFNIISGEEDSGVDCAKYTSGCPTDGNGIIIDASVNGGQSNIPPALIIGNVIFENAGRGIQNRGGYNNVWIINNTLYANTLYVGKTFQEIYAQGPGTNNSNYWINNIVYGKSSSASLYVKENMNVLGQKNIYFNGNNTNSSTSWFFNGAATDPQFVSPPTPLSYTTALEPWNLGNRLMLQSGSPAINSGQDPKTATGMNATLLEVLNQYLNKDVAGNNRYNGVIDIGAYEF